MNDIDITRMVLTTAVLAAVAALLAGPAAATRALADADGGAAVEATTASPVGPGMIPSLSHGIAVDESRFSGEESTLGLTGDSPLTRGDMPSTTTHAVSSGDDFDWTWVGVGGGLTAAFAAAMGALYLSARHRGRIALP